MKAHRTDLVSLLFGLLFLLVAAGFLAGSYLDFGLPHIGWFVAAGLILLGLVGAASALIPPKPAPVTPADPTGSTESAESAQPVTRPAEDHPPGGPMLAE